MDPIKLASLEKFGDPTFVAERVVNVERNKNGVREVKLLDAANAPRDGLSYYTMEYEVDSERGYYHYLAKLTVANGFLYVLTAKVKDGSWEEGRPAVQKILDTMQVTVSA